MRNRGFTLLELMISTSILSVVAGISFAAISAVVSTVAVAQAKANAQHNVRETMDAMIRELASASMNTNHSLAPALDPVQVTANPVAGSPAQIAFQTPADGSARNWRPRVTLRFLNEDANGNARLDSGEDTDHNGVLTRRIVRMEGAGPVRPVGGSNDLSNVAFALNGSELTITLTSTKLVGNRRTNPIRTTLTRRILLTN